MKLSTAWFLSTFIAASFCLLVLPQVGFAQSSELRETIRAEILKDPRAASIPESQLASMIDALAREAEAQGITPADITWTPANENRAAARCGFLCNVNAAFGFDGGTYIMPALLLLASAIGVFAFYIRRHYHRQNIAGL
ncbi:MAG TPA: hypothetical protein VJB97_01660 [Candidatus Paceibacterota bacterium]